MGIVAVQGGWKADVRRHDGTEARCPHLHRSEATAEKCAVDLWYKQGEFYIRDVRHG